MNRYRLKKFQAQKAEAIYYLELGLIDNDNPEEQKYLKDKIKALKGKKSDSYFENLIITHICNYEEESGRNFTNFEQLPIEIVTKFVGQIKFLTWLKGKKLTLEAEEMINQQD